ncbi:uncharacterized protein GLRG_04771 [Colletotrichum graminicola M1.001]|uniref:Uncharacterized protein n=1 Tax=Colletotrichum graminicola (strain M1.001 / M2 / FGSC 10212) TaxID=645133 RepID=E3QFI9_COLGM|nr:uncharacterized protein GLRG_04771 [Colletotrichum graminicola M1.001]EFQ29627.1 hypothetical protein GLRG_04771 [Colletotrichum graminicola M1.001]
MASPELRRPMDLACNTPSIGNGASYDNVTANRIRAAAHCFEARRFGTLCSETLGKAAIMTV